MRNLKSLKVKDGDIIEFIALRWDENWDFDCPCVIISPIVIYSPNGEQSDALIDEVCINLSVGEEVESEEDFKNECEWRHWNLATMKIVAKNRLAGKDDWKTKDAEVTYQKIKFTLIEGEEDEFDYEIIETKKV